MRSIEGYDPGSKLFVQDPHFILKGSELFTTDFHGYP